MLDVIIWLVFTLIIAPCVFCRDIRACCCSKNDGPTDPDHAKKLADVGVGGDLEAGGGGGGGGDGGSGNKIMWVCFKIALSLLLGYVAAMVILAIYVVALESSLVYSPESSTMCTVGATTATSCDYSTTLVSYTDVDFQSSGATLNGWYMESNASAPTPHVPVLYNHGSGKNVAVRYRVERYAFLLTLGVKMFTYDYPGYGKSTGTPTEEGIYAASKDAYDVLLARSGANATDVVLLGRSLGGGVAVNLATKGGVATAGMILQSTFASLAGTGGDGMPVLGWWITAIMSQRFDSLSKIGTYTKCLYESHSKADEWVQYDDGRALFDGATSANKACSEFVSVDTPLHDDPLSQTEKDALTAWVNARRAAMP